ncbi:hypothetical protein CIPAW_15G120000 [Carya illinoinensis]|uniref:Uncharacterized protein n=1 Tax=Carya illinoinensis TaxID=32201 RepID=A0A8T1NCP9_CARIL|nr:hypothetical protein CIPAW_15G120000 [Carya illinoinensis]
MEDLSKQAAEHGSSVWIMEADEQGTKASKPLERLQEISRILEFNGSHIRSLNCIICSGCDKLHEKIWTYKVPISLLWKGSYKLDIQSFNYFHRKRSAFTVYIPNYKDLQKYQEYWNAMEATSNRYK